MRRGPAIQVLVSLLLVACAAAPPPSTRPDPTPVETGPVEAVMLDAPWLPPWATAAGTPPEISERAAHRFCGVERGPEIDLAIRACFLAEVTAEARDIEFARIEPTVQGDLVATIYGFEPPGSLVIVVDSTQDRFGVHGWTVQACNRLVRDAATVFVFDDCAEPVAFR